MSDLVITGIEAGYGHVRVLHGVDLKVSDKPVALMGRNGMGKSTLAQVIMGLNPSTSGSIKYGNQTITGLPTTKIARAGIGYVPQGRRVFPSARIVSASRNCINCVAALVAGQRNRSVFWCAPRKSVRRRARVLR